MSRAALRFVHASDLLLDAPLRGLYGFAVDAQASVAGEAVRTLENIVAACLQHNADFLLLAGRTFEGLQFSLAEQVALRTALERLAIRDIPVFIQPADADEDSWWQSIPELPDNTTVLSSGEAAAVVRDGLTIAEIAAATAGDVAATERPAVSQPPTDPPAEGFQIAVLTAAEAAALVAACTRPACDARTKTAIEAAAAGIDDCSARRATTPGYDYIATVGDRRRTLSTPFGLMHAPGPARGLDPASTGAHGCTLVEISTDRSVRRTMIPTACVRRERFLVHVNEHTIRDELLSEMQFVLDRCVPEATEDAWLVAWLLQGVGPLFEELQDETFQRELTADLTWRTAQPRETVIHHRIRLMRDAVGTDRELRDHPLLAQFVERLDQPSIAMPQAMHALLDPVAQPADGSTALAACAGSADPEAVLGRARDLGREWFISATP